MLAKTFVPFRSSLMVALLVAAPLGCGFQGYNPAAVPASEGDQTSNGGSTPVQGNQSGLANNGSSADGNGTATGGGDNASMDGNSGVIGDASGETGGNNTTGGGTNANNVDTGARTFTFGAIIDYDGLGPHGKQSVADFVAKTKVVPDAVESYVRCKSDGSFELSLAKTLINQAAGSKVPTVCLSVTSEMTGNKLSTSQINGLVEAVNYGKSVGIAMEVRFGYEMNGYWSPSYNNNNPSIFLSQWAQLAPAIQKAGGKMMWSPNVPFNAESALDRWLPADGSTIDLVGMDYYPKDNPLTVATARESLSKIYYIAQKLNKPLYYGETAAVNYGSSISENEESARKKVQWLTSITDAKLREEMPLYSGFRWFDYQKYEDNRWNNWSISADSYAAAGFSNWYKTSVFVTGN